MLKSAAYPPLDGLFDLACRDGVDIRPTLLRVLTDLYVQKSTHNTEEETQYVELALGLIDSVDASTRAAVTARLSRYDAAPEAVLRRLKGAPAQPATAKVTTPSPASMPAPAPQTAAPAQSGPAPEDLAALFFAAGTEERRLILTNLDFAAAPTRQPPAQASDEMIRRLEAAALKRNPAEFTRLLEQALGIAPELAVRIVGDRSGEPIVVAAKVLGMQAAVLQRILLFLDPMIGQSVERVYGLSDLYDEITFAAAAQMRAIWRGSSERRRPSHVPQYAENALRRAPLRPREPYALTPGRQAGPPRRDTGHR